jgi:tyrosyl-tRNA synthetase
MKMFRSDLLHVLSSRGFIHQGTNLEKLDAAAATGEITGYSGFDATADSLHVGHLLPIMMLRWMQKTGHKVIILMGGGTTKVGDPSGRDESRQLLTNKMIKANINSIKRIFAQLGFFHSTNAAELVNNAKWLDHRKYVPFLRRYGRHFSVNRMLGFDSVKLRLEREQPLSFLEFNYMILQAYDFVYLYENFGCTLQIGGSDQWGNIVNGIELGRRVVDAELYGLTCPLLTTASGTKMGKTASGAVWLNADRLSEQSYFQFWRNTEDSDIGRFLRLFTELPLDEIERLEALKGAEINVAKIALAYEATKLAHGRDAAEMARKKSKEIFEQGILRDEDFTVELNILDKIENGSLSVAAALTLTGLSKSNSEARNLIANNQVKMNAAPVILTTQMLTMDDVVNGKIRLSKGKRNFRVLKLK